MSEWLWWYWIILAAAVVGGIFALALGDYLLTKGPKYLVKGWRERKPIPIFLGLGMLSVVVAALFIYSCALC